MIKKIFKYNKNFALHWRTWTHAKFKQVTWATNFIPSYILPNVLNIYLKHMSVKLWNTKKEEILNYLRKIKMKTKQYRQLKDYRKQSRKKRKYLYFLNSNSKSLHAIEWCILISEETDFQPKKPIKPHF